MDINQDSTETKPEEQKKPEVQLPKVELPKIYMPKLNPKEWPNKLKLKLKEYRRVLQITRKPTSAEYKAIVKASGIGIIVIGLVGFVIHMIVQVLML